MKFNNIKVAGVLIVSFITVFASCKKDDSEKEYGFSKIYMPQAISKSGGVNNNYPVPSGSDSSTFNYQVDRKDNKVLVTLGAILSGPGKDAYSVDIKVDNDTIQKLFNSRALDSTVYKLMPSSIYTLPPSLEVAQGNKAGTFSLAIDITRLKSTAFTGKFLVLAVKVANPSRYELNAALSTTIVIVDVNLLVIGPAVNVTSNYIKNPGGPFIREALQPGQSRWGTLKDWKTNAAALSHGGFGGWSSDNGGTMNMESGWGSPKISNGKIYQTIDLPAGRYSFDISGGAWAENFTKDIAYAVVAPGADLLPDYSNIVGNAGIMYQAFAKPVMPLVIFELAAPSKVTLGVVVNYAQDEQGFKTSKVTLFNYPKAL